ncbi:MAG: Basal-body rod modification protein FlgD [Pseudomonadota bacterium]|jgi:flagellar basal-body rod modification protein FlgD
MSINASTYQVPSSIPTLSGQKTDYTKVQNEEMGEREFLLLFTTQLQNQNPLDPMENEAFVAQLAQFSQLEATTTMSDKMTGLVDSLKGQRLTDGAALIGKQVAVPDGPAILKDGAPISGLISVPDGANSVSYKVYNRNGTLVKSEELGRKPPGDVLVRWDGTNQAGDPLEDGAYRMVATVRGVDGSVTQLPISTPDTVKSVSYSSEADDLVLETVNGGTVNLSQVKQING